MTFVRSEQGVTLQDIIVQLYKECVGLDVLHPKTFSLTRFRALSYVDVPVTEAEVAAMSRGEWAQLNRRLGKHSPRPSADGYFAATGMTPVYGVPGQLPASGYAPNAYGPYVAPVPHGPPATVPYYTAALPGQHPSYGAPLLVGVSPTAGHGVLYGSSPHHSPAGSGGPSPAMRPSQLNALRTGAGA